MLISQIGTMLESIKTVKTMRPPNLSVHIPSGRRISEPVRIGVAASRPNWVSVSCRPVLIGMPMMENITHTAKQTVKARVFMVRTDSC